MCEYCSPGQNEVIASEQWEDGFIKTSIRFYTVNYGELFIGADTITENGKKYNTCKRVNYCPMCGEHLPPT